MLAQSYKFVLVNKSGQTVDANTGGEAKLTVAGVFVTPSTGKLAYADLAVEDFGLTGVVTIANGAELVGAIEYDNTSNLYINTQVKLAIIHDAGSVAEGAFDLYLATSTGVHGLETAQSGYADAETNKLHFIGSLTWPAGASDANQINSATFLI